MSFAKVMAINQTLQNINFTAEVCDDNYHFVSDEPDAEIEKLFEWLEKNYSLLTFKIEVSLSFYSSML